MNKEDLFYTLKHEIYQSIPSLVNNTNEICEEVFRCYIEYLNINLWIDTLLVNKKTFKYNLESEEHVSFVNRLLFGLSFVQNPENVEAIKRLRSYILNNKNRFSTYKKVFPNLSKKIYGLDYLEKKKSLLNKIDAVRYRLENFYEYVFIIFDLLIQMEEIVEVNKSLEKEYIVFINNENIKFLKRLQLICNYALTSEIEKIPEFVVLKSKKN